MVLAETGTTPLSAGAVLFPSGGKALAIDVINEADQSIGRRTSDGPVEKPATDARAAPAAPDPRDAAAGKSAPALTPPIIADREATRVFRSPFPSIRSSTQWTHLPPAAPRIGATA